MMVITKRDLQVGKDIILKGTLFNVERVMFLGVNLCEVNGSNNLYTPKDGFARNFALASNNEGDSSLFNTLFRNDLKKYPLKQFIIRMKELWEKNYDENKR